MSRNLLIRRSIIAVSVLVTVIVVASSERQLGALAIGIGSGALIAVVALSIVMTFRGSGVVNFATAGTAMYSAYVYESLRNDGRLFIPPLPNPLAVLEWLLGLVSIDVNMPDIPTGLQLATPATTESMGVVIKSPAMAIVPAILLTIAVCAALGALFHYLVFRPLRHAPPLANVVASVGLLIMMQATVILRFGTEARSIKPLLEDTSTRIPLAGVSMPRDQLYLAGIAVLLAVVLWLVYQFTHFGLATRAAAENEKGAVLLGSAPSRLAAANWIGSTVMVGLLGVLAAPVNKSLDPTTITLLIVPALAAALVGRLSSFGVTVAAGLAIGMGQSWLRLISTFDWFPRTSAGLSLPGMTDLLPLAVIVAMLWFRGNSLPVRGSLEQLRMPPAPAPQINLAKVATFFGMGCALLLLTGPTWRLAMMNSMVGMALCLSFVVVVGYLGQISLVQMGIAGISGFALSKLAETFGIPFPLAPILGATIAAVFGTAIAFPALRVRGVQLAIVTFAAAVTIERFILSNPDWSNGGEGAPVGPPRFLGLELGPLDVHAIGDGKLPDPVFGLLCLVVVTLLAFFVVSVRRSFLGRRMLAVRANERAAAAAGVPVAATKLLGFAVGSFVAGIGGALSAYRFGGVTPLYFGAFASLLVLAYAYLGGITSVTGAIVGGLVVNDGLVGVAFDEWFDINDRYTMYLGGFGLVFAAVKHPEGISGFSRHVADAVRARRGRLPRGPSSEAPRFGRSSPDTSLPTAQLEAAP